MEFSKAIAILDSIANSNFAKFDHFKDLYSRESTWFLFYSSWLADSALISVFELGFGIALYFGRRYFNFVIQLAINPALLSPHSHHFSIDPSSWLFIYHRICHPKAVQAIQKEES